LELLDVLTIRHPAGEKAIEAYWGDLTALVPEEAVDILVVSAVPGNLTLTGCQCLSTPLGTATAALTKYP
jgi:hypothetical protein